MYRPSVVLRSRGQRRPLRFPSGAELSPVRGKFNAMTKTPKRKPWGGRHTSVGGETTRG